jgi:pyruvate dehydrogenase E1 component alpha subunit
MLRIRMVEEKIVSLYPEQEMRCPVHLGIGQEAVSAGVCENLSKDDYLMASHRSHGPYLAKGSSLKAMIAELYGRVTGCCGGRGGSQHLIDLSCGFLGAVPIVASTVPIAAGAALAFSMRGEKKVSAVFFGDAAVEEGMFHEALNFASLRRLPVIFICENNLYSTQSPLSVRQPQRREISRLAEAHKMKGFRGDGNDVLNVYDITSKAVSAARSGRGPSLLEFKTYRWLEHCGPYDDSKLGYRSKKEIDSWKKRCPIRRFQNRVLREKLISKAELDDIRDNICAEVEEAFDYAKQSPFPKEDSFAEGVYR